MGNKSPSPSRDMMITAPEGVVRAFSEPGLYTFKTDDNQECRVTLKEILSDPLQLDSKVVNVPSQANCDDLLALLTATEARGIDLQMKVGESFSRILDRRFFQRAIFASKSRNVFLEGKKFVFIKRTNLRFLSFSNNSSPSQEEIAYVLSELAFSLSENLSGCANLSLHDFPNFLIRMKKRFIFEIQFFDVPLACFSAFTEKLSRLSFKYVKNKCIFHSFSDNKNKFTNEKAQFLKNALCKQTKRLMFELDLFSEFTASEIKKGMETELALVRSLNAARSFEEINFKFSLYEVAPEALSQILALIPDIARAKKSMSIILNGLSKNTLEVLQNSKTLPDELSLHIENGEYDFVLNFKLSNLNSTLRSLSMSFDKNQIKLADLGILLSGLKKLQSFEISLNDSTISDQDRVPFFFSRVLSSNPDLLHLKLHLPLTQASNEAVKDLLEVIYERPTLLSLSLSFKGILLDEALRRPYVKMLQRLRNLTSLSVSFANAQSRPEEREFNDRVICAPLLNLKALKAMGLVQRSQYSEICLLVFRLRRLNKIIWDFNCSRFRELERVLEKKRKFHKLIFNVICALRRNNLMRRLRIREEIKTTIALYAMGL